MTKVDIATMANSLEARSPLLDHELMEYAFRLRGKWKLNGFQRTKWIFKEAFRAELPASILKRSKMGFGIPLGPWFRGKLRDYWKDHVLSSAALARGYFCSEFLNKMFEEHVSGRRNHGYRMWSLLMLELWHENCLPAGSIG
jgi:asparagine synthase (glutamine-hydrolysing)